MRELPHNKKSFPGSWRCLGGVIHVTCPTCGRVLALGHEISANGIVAPSLQCPTTGCFHDHVILLNYPQPNTEVVS